MTTANFTAEGISTFSTQAERYAEGRDLRTKVPRSSHEEWAAASDRS